MAEPLPAQEVNNIVTAGELGLEEGTSKPIGGESPVISDFPEEDEELFDDGDSGEDADTYLSEE